MISKLLKVWNSASRGMIVRRLGVVSLDGSPAPQVHQQIAGKQRFYKEVGVMKLEEKDLVKAMENKATAWICKLSSSLYCVTLDGRKLRTPGRHPMIIPTQELAWGIANEWDAQVDKKRGIQPASMPLMSLFSTAIDQIAVDPTHARSTVLSYLPTDSALFFTSEDDRILLQKQKDILGPVLQWMKDEMDIELNTTDQMTLKVEQSPEVHAKVEAIVHMLDPFSLACLQCMTMECKSIVLALACLFGHLNLEGIKAASRIEEEFQVEIWGVVEGGHDMDRLNNSVSLSSAGAFFGMLSVSNPHHQAIRNRKFSWSPN